MGMHGGGGGALGGPLGAAQKPEVSSISSVEAVAAASRALTLPHLVPVLGGNLAFHPGVTFRFIHVQRC